MSVPDTTTFTFQDVTTEIYNDTAAGRSLYQAFQDASPTGFDPAYEGSKNSLLNFRNYTHSLYFTIDPTSVQLSSAAQGSQADVATNYGDLSTDNGGSDWIINVALTNVGGNNYTLDFDVTLNDTGDTRNGGIDVYSGTTNLGGIGIQQLG